MWNGQSFRNTSRNTTNKPICQRNHSLSNNHCVNSCYRLVSILYFRQIFHILGKEDKNYTRRCHTAKYKTNHNYTDSDIRCLLHLEFIAIFSALLCTIVGNLQRSRYLAKCFRDNPTYKYHHELVCRKKRN